MNGGTPDFADVTVIVPAWRAAKTIDRALDSIAAQTLKPRAVVVVDDGSPDDTFSKARAWRDRFNGIRLVVLRQDNAGPGAARNRALAEARTEFVAFLDADDEWLPEKLARSMACMKSGDYVLVAHDSVEVDGDRVMPIDCARRFRAAGATPYVGLYRRGFIDTATVLARTDVVRAAGGFDATLPNGQDFALWLAMLADPGARFLVFDEALSRYHRTPGSVMSHIDRRRRCCMAIARRHVFDLRRHPGLPLASLWFRTVAVHKEAFDAHRARNDMIAAMRTLLALPANLIAASAAYLFGRPPALRPHGE
jgi:glycosyltransferase involved in cell wall biosynthesis